MNGVPTLSRSDLAAELEKLYRQEPNRVRHLFAFFGTGADDTLEVPHAGRFFVAPVRSELELRERMVAIDADDDARFAFLVPWTGSIPLDLSGRFARSGRVLRVGPEARLLTMLGASEVDDDVRRSRLAAFLLASPPTAPIRVPAGRVTATALWDAWLSSAWGVDTSDGLGLESLLAWAALDQRGPAFVEAMSAPAAAGVRDELLTHLHAQRGPAGPVVWRAWESGRGRAPLTWALLFETLASSDHAGVKMWVSLAPRAALGVGDDKTMIDVAKALGEGADGALRRLERRGQPGVARTLVRSADELVQSEEVREALALDRRLPSAWRRRLDALGEALARAAKEPSPSAVEGATAALRSLEGHSFFTDADQTITITRAEMAVRLAAWLTARPDRAHVGAPTPYADVELLGRWYADEGGHLDWARRAARGTETDAFGAGAAAVVRAVDAAREELDRRFARALAAWVEAGRPSPNVVPIDEAVRRIGARFVAEEPSRSLLVLLLDGMAWAQAVEILQSLGSRTIPWGPLAWHATTKGRIGRGAHPVVLANLPTVTDVSRAAFFGGKTIGPGEAWNTAKDVQRWAANRDVAPFVPPTDAPRLLLRAEGHTQAGAASSEAVSLVRDTTRRMVAIVINAVDASLKGDPQQRHAWTVDSIASLPDLLEAAREAGRAVLLASDHGHVPADRLATRGTYENAGARYRPWLAADEVLGAHEVGFRGSPVWCPRGAHGVVLLADDASRYGAAAHAGEHGGATLAEVVTPCLLIGSEDLAIAAEDDRGVGITAAHVPPWWHFDAGAAPSATTDEATVAPARPKKPANANQLALLPVEPTAPPAPAPAPPPKVSAFAASEVLASLVKSAAESKPIVDAVEVLLERQGVISEAAFAAALRVPTWRIGGVVAKLQEVLNVEAYQVLRYDAAAKMIHLDRSMLAVQFEVTL